MTQPPRTRPDWVQTLFKTLLVWLPLALPSLSYGQGINSGTPSPLAHWRFEEGSGPTTRDVQGRWPGILSPGASFTNAGIAGSALALNATLNGDVNFGDILPLTNTAYTISVWFKTPPGDTNPEAAIVGKHRPWFENGYYLLLNGGGGTLAGYGCAGAFPYTSMTLNDGQWHHVIMAVSASGEVRLHVDGPAVSTIQGGAVIPSPAAFMIGGIDPPPPARRFNGLIDEVQIYGADLNQDAIDFLHAHPGLNLAQRDVITFSPPTGPVFNPATVTLSTTITAGQIRYTIDGSEPVITSALYSAPFSLSVTGPVTVRARVFVNGFPASEIRAANYEPDPGIRFTPAEPRFTNQLSVSIVSILPGVSIRYTTDGIDPTVTSTEYTVPIVISNASVLRARAFINGFPVTEVIAKRYFRVYAFDDDGIATAWRIQHFGPDYAIDIRAGADADPDGDGSTNRQEFLANTNPLDPREGFLVRIRAIPEIRFPSVAGVKYRILRRVSLEDPSPVTLTEITATQSEIVYVDPDAGVTANPAFYLVQPIP